MYSATDIANEIYFEQGEDSSMNLPSITYWLTSNIGHLNTILGESISITDGIFFDPEITETQKSIYKLMYLRFFTIKKINANTGANAYEEDWSELSEGDSRIRRVSKNEVAKTLLQLKRDYDLAIDELAYRYKANQALPSSVDYAAGRWDEFSWPYGYGINGPP